MEKKANWKEVAQSFYNELAPEEIEEFINSNTIIKFFQPGKVRDSQKAENAATKVLNEYYTKELKKALKNYKPKL